MKQRRSCPELPRLRDHEQIVQDVNPRHGGRGEARIQLGKADRGVIVKGEEDHRLVVIKALHQETPRTLEITLLTIKQAVSVKERNQQSDVRRVRLPHLDAQGNLCVLCAFARTIKRSAPARRPTLPAIAARSPRFDSRWARPNLPSDPTQARECAEW